MINRHAYTILFLTESLKGAAIYVNGDRAQINAKEVFTRINEALGRLVKTVYHKLDYIDYAASEDGSFIRTTIRSRCKNMHTYVITLCRFIRSIIHNLIEVE